RPKSLAVAAIFAVGVATSGASSTTALRARPTDRFECRYIDARRLLGGGARTNCGPFVRGPSAGGSASAVGGRLSPTVGTGFGKTLVSSGGSASILASSSRK